MSAFAPDTLLLCFEDELASAARLAEAANLCLQTVERHHFPDGEIKLRIVGPVPRKVIIFRSLNNPNEKLVELLLCAQTARALGAQHITLVAPYLAYMRQDIAFHPGEAISQRIVGRFIADLFNAVITVDPHLHRISNLQEAVPVRDAIVLSAAPLLSDLIAARLHDAVLIGPDEESAQWVGQAANRHQLSYTVCRKVRHGDRSVDVVLPDIDVTGRQAVLLDDIASTGHTLARAAKLLLEAGAASVHVAVTHALLAGDAMQLIQESGVSAIWSTDCIAHSSNAVSMAAPIAQALAQLRELT